MAEKEQIIDPRKQKMWDEEFKQYGIKVLPETAMYYEMESFFPSYVLVEKTSLDMYGTDVDERHADLKSSRLAFFTRNDKAYETDDAGNVQWYELEPVNVLMARMHMLDMMPQTAVREGVEGYIVPLQENNFFGSDDDVNAYLHNLMFWESLIKPSDCGPLMQRLNWLVQKLYAMRCDQRDSIIRLSENGVKGLNIDTDSTSRIVEYALNQKKDELERLIVDVRNGEEKDQQRKDSAKILLDKIYEMLNAAERMNRESQERQLMYFEKLADLQQQMRVEDERANKQKASYEEFWNQIRATIEKLNGDDK